MLQIQYKNASKRPLWLVEPQYAVGSDPMNAIHTESGPARIADILVSSDAITLTNLVAGAGLRINGKDVVTLTENNQRLMHGDIFSIAGLDLEVVDPKVLKAKEQSDVTVANTHANSNWSLKALNHALANRDFPLSGTLVFGRSRECDISLSVAHLSRRHAKITVTHDGLSVEDLDSSNGTFVNGKKIRSALLKDGDELNFDTLCFRVNGPVSATAAHKVEDDGDHTTMRPTLDLSALKAFNDGVASSNKSTQEKEPKSKPRASRPSPRIDMHNASVTPLSVDKDPGNKSGILIAAIAVIALVVGAYFVVVGV